jgi:hypothetical protein
MSISNPTWTSSFSGSTAGLPAHEDFSSEGSSKRRQDGSCAIQIHRQKLKNHKP